MTLNRELPPIEQAAEALNARHRTNDMHARRQEAILAGRSLLNVEQMAMVIQAHWLRPIDEPYGGAKAVSARMCNCGHTLRPQYFEWRHFEEHNTHVAEAIRAAQLGEHA